MVDLLGTTFLLKLGIRLPLALSLGLGRAVVPGLSNRIDTARDAAGIGGEVDLALPLAVGLGEGVDELLGSLVNETTLVTLGAELLDDSALAGQFGEVVVGHVEVDCARLATCRHSVESLCSYRSRK